MAEEPLIRAARPADRSGLLHLWLDLIEYHRRLDPEYPAPPGIREVLLEEIDRGLRAPACQIGVAESGTELVGFVFAESGPGPAGGSSSPRAMEGGQGPLPGEAGVGWVHELYVDPAWRRRAVAGALLAFADRFLSERGGVHVSVRVESGNEEGLRFWLRRGFTERARILTR